MLQIIRNDTNIDFIGRRKLFGMLSLLVCLLSIAAAVVIGPNYGIDFKGGSDIILKFEKDVTADQVRAAAVTVFDDANVQRFGEKEKNEFLIQTQDVSVMNAKKVEDVKKALEPLGAVERVTWSPEQPDRLDVLYKAEVEPAKISEAIKGMKLQGVEVEQQGVEGEPRYMIRFQDLGEKVSSGFAAAMGDAFDEQKGLERLETVGPRVGEQLRNSGVLSILVALLLILIYIGFRFDIRYAPGAVVALTHDVIISIGVFTVIQMEVSLPIIAALLTIVGYSLNDTIVVFDRIRENLTAEGDHDVTGIVNRSVNETLSRTFITSLTTLLAVFAIYFFGGGLIQDFAFSLIVGIVVGTYSSIFIASPVMVAMDSYIRTRRESQKVAQA